VCYESRCTDKWQFTSYERDAESGNDYAMARYHVNRLGRFNSPDLIAGSVADPQSLNRFSYVRNDPVGLVDPLGLTTLDVILTGLREFFRPHTVVIVRDTLGPFGSGSGLESRDPEQVFAGGRGGDGGGSGRVPSGQPQPPPKKAETDKARPCYANTFAQCDQECQKCKKKAGQRARGLAVIIFGAASTLDLGSLGCLGTGPLFIECILAVEAVSLGTKAILAAPIAGVYFEDIGQCELQRTKCLAEPCKR